APDAVERVLCGRVVDQGMEELAHQSSPSLQRVVSHPSSVDASESNQDAGGSFARTPPKTVREREARKLGATRMSPAMWAWTLNNCAPMRSSRTRQANRTSAGRRTHPIKVGGAARGARTPRCRSLRMTDSGESQPAELAASDGGGSA